MHGDNPAGRLLTVLEAGKRIKPEESCRVAWSTILKVGRYDHSQMMIRMGQVMALPANIIKVLSVDFESLYAGKHHEHLVACLGSGFAKQSLDGQWATFIGHIDSHAISNLQFISHLFETSRPSKVMSEDDMMGIRTKTEDLIKFVLESDFSPPLKKFLIEKLRSVVDALDDYYITGAEPVMSAVASTIGHAYLNAEYRAAVKTEQGSAFAERLAVIADSVTIATATVQLGISSVPLLEFAVRAVSG